MLVQIQFQIMNFIFIKFAIVYNALLMSHASAGVLRGGSSSILQIPSLPTFQSVRNRLEIAVPKFQVPNFDLPFPSPLSYTGSAFPTIVFSSNIADTLALKSAGAVVFSFLKWSAFGLVGAAAAVVGIFVSAVI